MPKRPPPNPRPGRRPARGLSIIELMIGVTIGLFILAGATLVASTQMADNRRMLLEMQVQQDLRATLDMVARDMRRTSYWAKSWLNVWPTGAGPAMDNPYTAVTSTSTSLVYDRSQDEADGSVYGTDNNAVDSDERVGFRFNSGQKTVEMLIGTNNWQALTDPQVLEVTQFGVTFTNRTVPAPCGEQCPAGPSGCPLALRVRDAAIVLAAKAVHDPTVVRSVQSNIRLRNDVLVEVCP